MTQQDGTAACRGFDQRAQRRDAGALPLLVIGADTLTGFTPEQMDLRLYGARRGGS